MVDNDGKYKRNQFVDTRHIYDVKPNTSLGI